MRNVFHVFGWFKLGVSICQLSVITGAGQSYRRAKESSSRNAGLWRWVLSRDCEVMTGSGEARVNKTGWVSKVPLNFSWGKLNNEPGQLVNIMWRMYETSQINSPWPRSSVVRDSTGSTFGRQQWSRQHSGTLDPTDCTINDCTCSS
jgi:hypothetical protein